MQGKIKRERGKKKKGALMLSIKFNAFCCLFFENIRWTKLE